MPKFAKWAKKMLMDPHLPMKPLAEISPEPPFLPVLVKDQVEAKTNGVYWLPANTVVVGQTFSFANLTFVTDKSATVIFDTDMTAYKASFDLSPEMYALMINVNQSEFSPSPQLSEVIPDYDALVPYPCDCSETDIFGHKDRLSVQIIHLNDCCGWSRERIADWLESLDLNLNFQVPAQKEITSV